MSVTFQQPQSQSQQQSALQMQQQQLLQFTNELSALLDLGEKLTWSLYFFVHEESKASHRTLNLSMREDVEVLRRLESIVKFVAVRVAPFASVFLCESPNCDRLGSNFLKLLCFLRDIDVIITNNTRFFLDFLTGLCAEKSTSIRKSSSGVLSPSNIVVAPGTPSSPLWHGSPSVGSPNGNSSNSSSSINSTNNGGNKGLGLPNNGRGRKNTLSSRLSTMITGRQQLQAFQQSLQNISGGSLGSASMEGTGNSNSIESEARPITIKRSSNTHTSPSAAHDYSQLIEWYTYSADGSGPCLAYLKAVLPLQVSAWSCIIEHSLNVISTTEAKCILPQNERNALLRGMALCFYLADVPVSPPSASVMAGSSPSSSNSDGGSSNSPNNSGSNSNNSSSNSNIFGSYPQPTSLNNTMNRLTSSVGGGGGGDGTGSCDSLRYLFGKVAVWLRSYPFFPVCCGGYADCLGAQLLPRLPELGRFLHVDVAEAAAAQHKAAEAKCKELDPSDFDRVEAAVQSIGPNLTNTQSVAMKIVKVFDGLYCLEGCADALTGLLLSCAYTTDMRLLERSLEGVPKWEVLFSQELTAEVLRMAAYIKGFQSRVVRLPRDVSQNALAMLREELARLEERSEEYATRLQRAGVAIGGGAAFSVEEAHVAVVALVALVASSPTLVAINSCFNELAIRHIKYLYGLARFFEIFNEYANLSALWFIDSCPIPRPLSSSSAHFPLSLSSLALASSSSVRNPVALRSHTYSLSMQKTLPQPSPLSLDPSPMQQQWNQRLSMTTSALSPRVSQSPTLQAAPRVVSGPLCGDDPAAAGKTVLGVGPAQKERLLRCADFYGEFPVLNWEVSAWSNSSSCSGKEGDEWFEGCRYITYTYKVLAKEVLEGTFGSTQVALMDYVYSDARLVYARFCPRLCHALDVEYSRKPQGLCHELAQNLILMAEGLLGAVMPRDGLEAAVEFLLGCADVMPVTLSDILQDVIDTAGRERVVGYTAAMISYRLAILAEEAEQISSSSSSSINSGSGSNNVDNKTLEDKIVDFILHQLAYNMVLEFVGAPSRLVAFETPVVAFCKLCKTGVARQLFWMMFATHIYADRRPVDEAGSAGIVALVQEIVTATPAAVHIRDRTQNSLLHWAARMPLPPAQSEALLRFLASNGCDLEARNSEGATPLLNAATPEAATTLACLGARLNVACIDGRGLAQLHPEWVPALQQALGVTQFMPPETISVINVAVATTPAATPAGAAMDLALRFAVMCMVPVPYGALFAGDPPVFPWLGASAMKSGRCGDDNSGEKFGAESWPLVALEGVEGAAAGSTVLARVGVAGLMDSNALLECTVLLTLYTVGNADSLDFQQLQESIAPSQAISRFLVGVGVEVRSDKAAITKYWEQRALPVRLEDAIRVARLLRVYGFAECQDNCTDVFDLLCAAVQSHTERIHIRKPSNSNGGSSSSKPSPVLTPAPAFEAAEPSFDANGNTNDSVDGSDEDNSNERSKSRIKTLVPMLCGDACCGTVKMLVLGHEEAGKTSLLDSISEKHSWKTFSKAIWKKRTAQTMSTIGINKVPLSIGEVPVNAYDFGGQLEYHAIHEYFLSPYCAMYLVVVDGSKENLTEQLSYWLQLLHSHAKGPRGSCVLIVVCTKADVIEKRFGADAVNAKRAFLADYLSHWPSLRKIADAEVFMVSNKTGSGIKALRDAVKERLRALSKTPVPSMYLAAGRAVAAGAQSVFLSFGEFVQLLVQHKVLTARMPPEYSRQITRDILDFLHNSGQAVVSSGYDVVCCHPELMSHVLSLFVAPSDHLRRLLHAEGCVRMDVLTRTEFVRRLKLLPDIKSIPSTDSADALCAKIIASLEDMKFCYALSKEEACLAYNLAPFAEECYIFPSLCDTVDFVALPYNEAADRGPDIIRLACHGYECAACRARYAAAAVPPGAVCPACGCTELAHVCLNEAPGAVPGFIGTLHPEVHSEYLPLRSSGCSEYMWACLVNVGGTSQVVTIPRPCPCVEAVPYGVRYVACTVTSMLEQGISVSQFDRVAVQLRRHIHPRYRLFRNFVVFRDPYGNVVLATLFTKDRQRILGIIARGPVPHLWAESLHPLLTLGEVVTPTCPACAHFNAFSAITKNANSDNDANAVAMVTCESGHQVPEEYVYAGMLRDERLCSESTLWGPKKSAAFYEESHGNWLTDPHFPNATFTELTAREASPARRLEYIYARSLFYKFVGTDPASSQFRLTKVVFIENKATEELFSRKFGEFAARAYSGSQGAAAAQQSANGKKPSADKVAWQQWILGHLGKCLERVCGNEQINLVGGWHGTINKSAHGIANTNFYMPAENKESKDPGYFGKGVYFTQSPAYGVDYAVFSANITKQHAKETGRTDYTDNDLTPCLVFSWILLGHVYPVTEAAAMNSPDSLMGKGCVEGYDSHYIVLPQQQKGYKNSAITKPYNPNSLLEAPGCDEIVVFNKAQILPRYIFYYEKSESAGDTKWGFLPIEVRDAKTVALWVDEEITSCDMLLLQTYVKKAAPGLAIVPMVSSSELKSWLHQYGQEVEDKIVVITSSFRANDGEANAAWRVINEVRKVAKLKKVPILVYRKKEPIDQIEHFAKMKLVYTASDNSNILLFIQQKKL